MKKVSIFNPVYKTWAYFLPAWPEKKVEKWLNQGNKGEPYVVVSSAEGQHWRLEGYGNAIWLRNWCGHCSLCLSTFAHEVTHLSMNVLDRVHIKVDWPKGEELTYLIEYYIREFYEKAPKLKAVCKK